MNSVDIEKLLFSEYLADLVFVWKNGTEIPAHKLVVLTKAPNIRLDLSKVCTQQHYFIIRSLESSEAPKKKRKSQYSGRIVINMKGCRPEEIR